MASPSSRYRTAVRPLRRASSTTNSTQATEEPPPALHVVSVPRPRRLAPELAPHEGLTKSGARPLFSCRDSEAGGQALSICGRSRSTFLIPSATSAASYSTIGPLETRAPAPPQPLRPRPSGTSPNCHPPAASDGGGDACHHLSPSSSKADPFPPLGALTPSPTPRSWLSGRGGRRLGSTARRTGGSRWRRCPAASTQPADPCRG